jgi:hypothetical protein
MSLSRHLPDAGQRGRLAGPVSVSTTTRKNICK